MLSALVLLELSITTYVAQQQAKKKTNLTRKPLANPDCCRETLPFAWPLRGTKAGTKHELSKTFKGKSNLMCG